MRDPMGAWGARDAGVRWCPVAGVRDAGVRWCPVAVGAAGQRVTPRCPCARGPPGRAGGRGPALAAVPQTIFLFFSNEP